MSTAHDLLTFARFHLGQGGQILKAASIKAMQKPTISTTGIGQMGISWFVTDVDGMRIIHHGGATNGQNCGFWFIPEKDFALVLLTNSSETRAERILNKALEIYFDTSIPEPEILAMDSSQMQDVTGKYENIEEFIHLSLKENELWLEFEHKGGFPTPESPPLPVPPPVRIGFYADDKVIALDEPTKGARGEFLTASDGTLRWFRYGSRIHKKIQ